MHAADDGFRKCVTHPRGLSPEAHSFAPLNNRGLNNFVFGSASVPDLWRPLGLKSMRGIKPKLAGIANSSSQDQWCSHSFRRNQAPPSIKHSLSASRQSPSLNRITAPIRNDLARILSSANNTVLGPRPVLGSTSSPWRPSAVVTCRFRFMRTRLASADAAEEIACAGAIGCRRYRAQAARAR
jgi:hypothetical protein